jgi:HEAT repeat protein
VALGQIGAGAKSAVPAIIGLLEKESLDSVKYAAAFALGEIDDAAEIEPVLTKLMQSEDLGLRAISARGLVKITNDPALREQAVKALLAALNSKDAHIRQLSIRTLTELEPPAEGPRPEIIEAFAAAMNDAEPEVVAEVIADLASKGKAAVPRVIRALSNEKLRPYAVRVAALIGADAEPAVPALVEAWKATDKDPALRSEIQFALGAIGPGAAPAVPELITSLGSDDPPVRNSACYALGKIGPAAKAAAAQLRLLLSSGDEYQRLISVWALLKILPQDNSVKYVAVPLLMGALQNDREEVRVEAIKALAEIGALAKPALPMLRQALSDDNVHVRDAAQEALEKLGKD